jgi:hypothetical protein
MMNGLKLAIAGAALVAVAGMTGCGEKEQVVVYKQGKYQGKADTKPWENDPGASLYTTSKWKAGDKTGWETALRSRNQNQNEYTRAE